MSNLTYTAEGKYDSIGNTTVNVYIPSDPDSKPYKTVIYNLSKTTPRGTINTVFCHFTDHSERAMQHNTPDYLLEFNINDLYQSPRSVSLDLNNSEILFIFFHSNNFSEKDRNLYFDQIETLYDLVKKFGNQSLDGIEEQTIFTSINSPRKVGLSLIKKQD